MGRCFSRHVPALKRHLLSIPHAAAEHFREASVMSEAHMSEIAATYRATVKWRRVKTTADILN